jgi:hypothetical protein
VDLLQRTQGNRRFSFSRGRGGEQVLLPFEGNDASQVQRLKDPVGVSVAPLIRQFSGISIAAPTTPALVAHAKTPARPELQVETLESFAEVTDETIEKLFNRFVSAESAPVTLRTFCQLVWRCGGGAEHTEPPYRRISRLDGLPWRARSVWSILDRRAYLPEYTAAPLVGKRAVVCGAGPCGLRAALELALLGAKVVVTEKRTAAEACGRINRIHLWEWCKQDLFGWGAKIFDPPGATFGADNDFLHIGIGELQLLLIKNALLLGVQFHFNCAAKGLEKGCLVCGNQAKLPCDFLFVADGANSTLSSNLGLRSMVMGLRGKGSAIGVVANFTNSGAPQQKALR